MRKSVRKIIIGICFISSLSGCAKIYTGAEIRDKLNSSTEKVIDWECLGEWYSEILDYSDTQSDKYFNRMNYNSYNLTKSDSEKQGIKLMRGEPYDSVQVEAVLSPKEAIITLGKYSSKLYYINTKSIKNITKLPEFYDGQWIPVNDNVCIALDGTKTHSYQTALGVRTVQKVTLIPRYMKNPFYKSKNIEK